MGGKLFRVSQLTPAQEAYSNYDAAKSAEVHTMAASHKMSDGEEGHSRIFEGMHKVMLSGIMQGMNMSALGLWTYALIAGQGAPWVSPKKDFLFFGMLAGSAKAGEVFMSVVYQTAYYEHEHSRETWEFQMHPDLEVQEFVKFVTPFGVTESAALNISKELAKFPEFSVQNHLVFELGLLRPECYDCPISSAAFSFGAHSVGMLLPFCVFEACRSTGQCNLLALGGGLTALMVGLSHSATLRFQSSTVQKRLGIALHWMILSAGGATWAAQKLCSSYGGAGLLRNLFPFSEARNLCSLHTRCP